MASEPIETVPAVMPVHVAVPGRARLRVAGLRGSAVVKRVLETVLPDSEEIRTATANAVTGNLLVSYDPELPLAAVLAHVERAVRSHLAPAGAEAVPPWHALDADEVLRVLESRAGGLSSTAARERAATHGANILPRLGGRSGLAMLLDQVRGAPILLLAGAAVLSVATGGVLDAAVILGVVALNAGIGFATESRAERIIASLGLPAQRAAPVRRNGEEGMLPAADIVPGDVLVLRPGIVVAADARVIASDALAADESMLTGESLPVAKAATPVAVDRPLADRAGMVYRGTTIVGGGGLAVVVATGARTEVGRIQVLVGEGRPPETPMQRQLGTLGRQLVGVSGAVCGAVLVIGLMRGNPVLAVLKRSVALAVAAVPEGLPALATTALALGIEAMRRRQVLVRRLDAVETLASVDVIAFDKTGTLTRNEMAAAAIACAGERLAVAGGRVLRGGAPIAAAREPDLRRLLEVGSLCSEARLVGTAERPRISGTPTEAALLRLAVEAGIDPRALRRRLPQRSIEYRSDGRQYMATSHATGEGKHLLAVKGSPEQVLALCRWRQRRGRRVALGKAARQAILDDNHAMAEDGLRVLGLAYAGVDATAAEDGRPAALTWLGLVGLADPARHEAEALPARFDRAGVRVIMLTGDQAATARAVARRLNLANGAPLEVVESGRLRGASDPEIAALVQAARVFARVTPADKLRIVQALQATGRVVAMTGDGINDGPALRVADVGIVMGRSGTDAARAVADIVLQGDDLSAIALALEHGRTTYGNIRKAIRYLLATNLSEVLVVLAAAVAGLAPPLTPIQLLWINLLSDVLPALGLALEPGEPGVLDEPPRDPGEAILRRRDMGGLAREGAVIAAGSLAAYGCGVLRHGASARASTIAFSSLVGAQLLHALTCRSAHGGLFGAAAPRPNRPLAGALAGSAALQLAILTVPVLRRLMGLAPLGVLDALICLAGAVLPHVVNEAAKRDPVTRGSAPAATAARLASG